MKNHFNKISKSKSRKQRKKMNVLRTQSGMLHVILSTICFKSMLKIQNSLQKPMQAHTKSNKKKEKPNRCSFFMELKINDSIVQCSNLA